MVHCPIFLNKESGITLTELLIVLAFIAFMAVAILVALNPAVQLGKARDARRKSDLNKLKNLLEDYYNDNDCYPQNIVELAPSYIGNVPKDPLSKSDYTYKSPDCDTYRIYVTLEYKQDPKIAEVGCQEGCGPGGSCDYNYGICSSNIGLEGCSEAECTQHYWVCQSGWCNDFGDKPPGSGDCLPGAPYFCGLPCGIGCRLEVDPPGVPPFEADCKL